MSKKISSDAAAVKMTGTKDLLLPHHRAMLREESGIHEDIIEERGYRSIETKAELKLLGFSASQLLVPTLLIPIRGVTGEIVLYVHRPDQPRIRGTKPVKYEFPAKGRMALDVPQRIRERIKDPTIPLFITEGSKKTDAAISRGLCCIAVLGVWNFRGTNEYGGKTVLADWEYIALKDSTGRGRRVYLVFDSDVMLKPEVYQALVRLAAFLKQRGADVAFIYLPHGEGGKKTGLDDYLVAGHTVEDLLGLATSELREPPREEAQGIGNPYRETPFGIALIKEMQSGPVEAPLTNFTARIVTQTIEDDGAETRMTLGIDAQYKGASEHFTIPADQFPNVGRWAITNIGAGAVILPGFGVADHVRAAIQLLSGDPPRCRVYLHTGWVEVRPGEWVYLHAGGAIGSIDPGSVTVRLEGALSGYHPRHRRPESRSRTRSRPPSARST